MTNSSKQAYFNPDNQARRISHKQKCYDALIGEIIGLTYPEIAVKAHLNPEQTWKRVSDLYKEEKIIIIGTRTFNNREFSVYRINNQPQLFQTPKLTFKQFVKQENPELWHKWEVLHEHKL